jgi:class 3 adenylate cyclase
MSRDTIDSLKRRLKRAKRAHRELERRMFHLKTLYDLSREIGYIDMQQIVRNLLMMVVGTFGAERGLILLVDTASGRIDAMAELGVEEAGLQALADSVAAGEFKDLGEVRGIQLLAGRTSGGRRRNRPLHLISLLGLRLWIPMPVTDRLLGGLGLGSRLTGERYSRDDQELLTTLSNQGVVALRNASAHQQVVRYAAELEANLRRIQILESIRTNLAKFVPKTVQELIEESPDAPVFDKREIDCSVLFADMTGYTSLSAKLDLDQVNKLVERYFGAFLDVILKHGGELNETAGDGLMVIFRKQDPSKHARAAVRAALAIQRRTEEINAELAGQGEPIAMKVAVNSGIAAVGATKIEGAAGIRWTYTASGPTTNVASRLAGLADGGAVIVSEETRRRLNDAFQVEDAGLQRVKNLSDPIRVYRVTVSESARVADSAV